MAKSDEERRWFIRATWEGERYACDLAGWYYAGGLDEDPIGIVPDLEMVHQAAIGQATPADGVPAVFAAERAVLILRGAKIERRKLPDSNDPVRH